MGENSHLRKATLSRANLVILRFLATVVASLYTGIKLVSHLVGGWIVFLNYSSFEDCELVSVMLNSFLQTLLFIGINDLVYVVYLVYLHFK